MVSIHVPCHNEPPDLVIGTLDALAALDYERFEVLVIDNNTRDPALWRPVQAHCAALGGRFRFLHVENMAGAKAGALNLALRHTAEDASLVAVVDADNQVETTFLSHLAAHFEDERLGFVQTWYDFREWSHSAFMTGCFWEYRAAFPATMRSLNERTAAFPMGTVVLFRRTAIAEAGGWAEWCMTEDSELGTRITALGYTSLLINRTYGRGLIPETLAAYKKQRYRWTFGPAQAIRRHWRLYLPPRYARPSRLTGAQRLFGMGAAISLVGRVGNLLTLPVAVAALGSALLHHDSLPGNPLLWLALPLSITATSVTRITTATLVMRCTLRESLLMLLCTSALAYTVQTASLAGLITSRSDWRHTRKFQARCTGWRAILTTRAETLLGSVVAATAITAMARDTSGLLLPIETAVLIRGLAYLTSPLAAVLAQRGIARRSLPTAQVPHPKSATELTAQR
jgi:cellulose synthase/poly-beta-1,6-N-acetylglucosamine synthase-like glycosyltransferase